MNVQWNTELVALEQHADHVRVTLREADGREQTRHRVARGRTVRYRIESMPSRPGPYRYHAWVLDALAAHGARPAPSTPPELLHDFVNDLYRYELRRLRAALLAGAFPKPEYYGRVVALRRRYPLLSLKPGQWLDEG